MPREGSRIAHAGISWALAALACTGDSGGTYTIRDSAGVTIVENADAGWTAGKEWRVDTVPSFDIGVADGDSALMLHEVVHARRLRDGRVAIANSGSSQVRIYDSAGRHLQSIGGRGRG